MTHPSLIKIEHALAHHKVTLMRDHETDSYRFRRLMRQSGLILCSEMTKKLELTEDPVICRSGERYAEGKTRHQEDIVIVSILRAGLPLGEAFAELLPRASIGQLGIYHNDDIDEPVCYMMSVPNNPETSYLLLDPVIAQGKTMSMAVDFLLDAQVPPERIRVGTILASSIGVDYFYSDTRRTDVKIYAFSADEPMDSTEKHLVYGFGNVGNRIFNTFGG